MAKLEIGIGADSSGFDKEILKVEKQLEKLKSQQAANIKLGLDTSAINKQISETTTKLNGLKSSLNSSTTAFANNSRATANGSSTLTQFSRIAQDAPFGIIGIGNNLTATAESFGYLTQSAGGAGNAFKAIGASLLGPGGLILAFSVVTSGLTYMAQEGITVGDVFDKLRGNFDSFAKSMQEANAEAAKNSSEQISSLTALASVAKNVSISMDERMLAVKELQKTYPAYFGNLTQEQILNGDLKDIIDDVTDALLAKAKAAAYSSRISKLAEEEINITEKIIKANKDLKESEIEAAKQRNNTAMAYSAGGIGAALGASANQVNNYKQTIFNLRSELKKNIDTQKKYQEEVNKTTAASIKLQAVPPKTITQPNPTQFKNPNPNFQGGNGFIGGGIVNPNSGIVAPDLGVDKQAIESAQKLKEGLALQEDLIKEFDANANALIENSVASTFANLGTAIGEALATGGNVLKAVGNSILQSMGKFLSDMGDMLIKYGTLAILKGKLDLAILTGGPVSIATGIAAIGVGVALKAIGGAIGARANAGADGSSSGVGNKRGSIYTGADVQTPTSSVNSGGGFSNNGGTVVFEISGQKLIGVLSNTLGANKRLGGNLAIG
jgi:hypothetical protein